MSQAFPLATLASLPEPVLSVYLDTNPLRHLNRNFDHGPVGWFNRSAKRLLAAVGNSEQAPLAAAIERVQLFLEEKPSSEQGIAIFAGPQVWQAFPLPIEPQNELHWGKPMLWQLAAINNRQHPWCVVTFDHSGARLFALQFSELTPIDILNFQVDPSHWKRMLAFHTGEWQAGMPHGPQRDLFERRYEANFFRFLGDVARRVAHACEARGLEQVLLFGPSRYTRMMEQELPTTLGKHTFHITHPDRDWESPSPSTGGWKEALQRVEAESQQRQVVGLLNGSPAVVIGAPRTLAMLQRGRLRRLVVEEAFNPVLASCTNCGYVNTSSAPECPRCHARVENRTLHELLPGLLTRHACDGEFPSGQAAEPLRAVGSMGGWLRQRPPAPPRAVAPS